MDGTDVNTLPTNDIIGQTEELLTVKTTPHDYYTSFPIVYFRVFIQGVCKERPNHEFRTYTDHIFLPLWNITRSM